MDEGGGEDDLTRLAAEAYIYGYPLVADLTSAISITERARVD